MTRLRIGTVIVLKSSLGIIRTPSYFHFTQHFSKITMPDRIKTSTLSSCYNKAHMDTTMKKPSIINFGSLTSYEDGASDPK
jgi:hypothetical protein